MGPISGRTRQLDGLEEEGTPSEVLREEHFKLKGDFEELIRREDTCWRQKHKVKSVKEGDCNTSFSIRLQVGEEVET